VTKIRFDNGVTVTIRDGVIQAPSPTLTAIIDTSASRLPGYGSLAFELDGDFNIARVLSRQSALVRSRTEIKCRPFPIVFLIAGDLRILAATVDDDIVFDSCSAVSCFRP
jgi:hypothetical protein